MPSLYTLTEDLLALDQLLAEEGGDVTEESKGAALESWIKEFNWKMSDKIDGYAGLIKNWESDVSACAEERRRLQLREKIILNRVDRLKNMARLAMSMLNTRKMEGSKFTITLAKNGGVLPMELTVEPDKVPEKFIWVERSPDMAAIRTALEACDPDAEAIARFGERGESVRVR
jgi:hypothetical protein